MIKVNEMRVGTTVEYQTVDLDTGQEIERPITVTANDIKIIEQRLAGHDKYFPIPLSEGILLRLGATKSAGDLVLYPSFGLQIRFYQHEERVFISLYTRSIQNDYTPIYYERDIEYLHHLQNIVFDLTGTELKLNP